MFWGPHLLRHGVDLFLSAEAPPGTGLGSSSAMAVALVRALAAYQGASLEAREAAELACRLEIEQLGMPIGKQDQYASAFGGLNTLTFTARGVQVCPLHLEPATVDALRTRLLLFATGRSHRSPDILREQRARTGRTAAVTESLHALKALAGEMAAALRRGDLDGFGRLLDVSWQHKKRLSQKISSEVIDGWYRAAREAGALGGKITGAGGGGFLLLYCPPQAQPTVRAAMGEAGLRELSFSFDRDGARVLTAGAGKRALPAGTRRREENALHA
jgi:D-glycero-alpha-D-manno-heptose-7-phosphate kinase